MNRITPRSSQSARRLNSDAGAEEQWGTQGSRSVSIAGSPPTKTGCYPTEPWEIALRNGFEWSFGSHAQMTPLLESSNYSTTLLWWGVNLIQLEYPLRMMQLLNIVILYFVKDSPTMCTKFRFIAAVIRIRRLSLVNSFWFWIRPVLCHLPS